MKPLIEQESEKTSFMVRDVSRELKDHMAGGTGGLPGDGNTEAEDEQLKKELFGDFFIDMAEYVSVDVRTEMAEKADFYTKNLAFLNEKNTLLRNILKAEDSGVATFADRIFEKIGAKKDEIIKIQKAGIKAEITGNPQTDAGLMGGLIDAVSELGELIRLSGEILENLEKAFSGDITVQEKQAMISKITVTESVPDDMFLKDSTVAQSILTDLKVSEAMKQEALEARIQQEREDLERLEREKATLDAQINEGEGLLLEKNETDIRVKYNGATLDEYVPKSALGKISSFTDYKKNKVEGVGKAKAFFDKKKLRGKELKERMEKHVRRFLSAKNGVTAQGMAGFCNVLMESSGVLTMDNKNERVSEEQKRRMSLLKALYNAGDRASINSLTAEARTLIRNTDKDEIPFGGDFYKAHPMAAKVIILRKLLWDMDSNALTGASEEYCGRIQALESNVAYLYGAIIGSDEYKQEVLKQKALKLESEIGAHREQLSMLLEKKEAGEETQEPVEKQKEEDVKEVLRRKVTGLRGREEERARQRRMEESRKSIAALKESIGKNNIHAIKSAHAVQISTREPVNSMDMGAAAYMDTLLKENLFKGLDGEDEAFFKKKITEQTARKLQKENKKLEDCTPEEVCGLVKAFELMVNKFLEDKTIKSFLEDCR
ncbi:MAG: hypothetical protein K6F44_06875, partial [Lachnospiraceae bacterium]|nr:hypothetical protein [Lachnospiraceae bacterium]